MTTRIILRMLSGEQRLVDVERDLAAPILLHGATGPRVFTYDWTDRAPDGSLYSHYTEHEPLHLTEQQTRPYSDAAPYTAWRSGTTTSSPPTPGPRC